MAVLMLYERDFVAQRTEVKLDLLQIDLPSRSVIWSSPASPVAWSVPGPGRR
jgi:hypothetical protein